MQCRAEVPRDRPAVRELHLTAFAGHGPVVADLVDALRERLTPTTGLSLVAEDAGRVVGHVMTPRAGWWTCRPDVACPATGDAHLPPQAPAR